jgi:hypothetical protein
MVNLKTRAAPKENESLTTAQFEAKSDLRKTARGVKEEKTH